MNVLLHGYTTRLLAETPSILHVEVKALRLYSSGFVR